MKEENQVVPESIIFKLSISAILFLSRSITNCLFSGV